MANSMISLSARLPVSFSQILWDKGCLLFCVCTAQWGPILGWSIGTTVINKNNSSVFIFDVNHHFLKDIWSSAGNDCCTWSASELLTCLWKAPHAVSTSSWRHQLPSLLAPKCLFSCKSFSANIFGGYISTPINVSYNNLQVVYQVPQVPKVIWGITVWGQHQKRVREFFFFSFSFF